MDDSVTNNQLMVVLESMRSEIKAVYEGYSVLSHQIAEVKVELKEDIALVDAKVMGLAKRVDHVEERLSREIAEVRAEVAEVRAEVAEVRAEVAEVRADLADHRSNTEMHRTQPKRRPLKKVA